MDLSHPLRSLVPSLDFAALEVLAGTESSLGTSQITRLARRGSRAGHQKVLDRLVAHGLVLAEPTNNGFVYQLNRDHLLAPAVLATANLRVELLDRLRAEVPQLSPEPHHASVFGSFARGEATSHSDIDLFLLMPDDYDEDAERWEAQLQRLEDRVLAWTGNRLEVLVLTLDGLDKTVAGGETVLDSLREESILLHGPGPNPGLAFVVAARSVRDRG